MPHTHHKSLSGHVLTIVASIVALSAVLLVVLASFGAWTTPGRRFDAPTAMELAAALERTGVTPETLAAVGATDQQVAALAADAAAHLDAERFAALEQADEAVWGAEARGTQLERRVRGGTGAPEDVVALRAAESDHSAALAAREALVDALLEAVRDDLSRQQAEALSRIRANAASNLPVHYRVVDRSVSEWVSLREALANVRINPRFGEDVDVQCQTLVAQCDAQHEVAAAKSSLESRLAQVTIVFEQALGLRG